MPDASQLNIAVDARSPQDLISDLLASGAGIFNTPFIDRCAGEIPAGTFGVVIFTDDFRFEQVVGALFALRRERPEVHTALVTDQPTRFAGLVAAVGDRLSRAIVPKPATAAVILERLHFRPHR
jgi:hypothetical protein